VAEFLTPVKQVQTKHQKGEKENEM